MEVNVTEHAKIQYRQRMQRFSLSETEVDGHLKAAALKGNRKRRCPGNAWEVKFENISVIVSYRKELATVITCLGNTEYRNWSKKQEIHPRYRERRVG